MANENNSNVDKAEKIANTAQKVSAYGPIVGQILATLRLVFIVLNNKLNYKRSWVCSLLKSNAN